ncbi:MAG: hypothetical protein Q8P67_16310 [archaeon]|nr:hypothetical protein [archaeon]
MAAPRAPPSPGCLANASRTSKNLSTVVIRGRAASSGTPEGV